MYVQAIICGYVAGNNAEATLATRRDASEPKPMHHQWAVVDLMDMLIVYVFVAE